MHLRDEDETEGDEGVETYRVDTVNTAADSVVDTGVVASGGGVGDGKKGDGC